MNFTVYKSSAGSGKTYTLVKEYLKIVLSHAAKQDELNRQRPKYASVLAITFTNKAAAEMKNRVIKALKTLSALPEDTFYNATYFNEMMEATRLDEKELRLRANNVLISILHNYSDFAISTIDKFVHKILRTFARDLHLAIDFEVEMDIDKLLSQAIDILISKAGTDEALTNVLVSFTESKINEEKSWNIEKDLLEFSTRMMKEESHVHLQKLKNVSINDFLEIRKDISSFIIHYKNLLKKLGTSAYEIIQSKGISHLSFYHGDKGISKYFEEISKEKMDKVLNNSYVRTTIEEDKWYSGKVAENEKVAIDTIKGNLQEYYQQIQSLIEQHHATYVLYALINNNLYALAVLNEIEKVLDDFKKEKNVLPISDFNKKIAAIVMYEPAPFIYERIGEKYQHFLIDEFQDTSVMQWHNLLPLIDNSLASANFNLVVGDGKQAIYRWRDGEVEQFSKLPQVLSSQPDELLTERENSLKRNFEEKVLQNNFRSKAEVVDFNNRFFKNIAQNLELNYQSIYANVEQNYDAEKTGGYVRIEVLHPSKEESYEKIALQRILKLVTHLLQQHYSLKDIAVLCRGNKEANAVANFLIENNLPVISSESILLNNAPVIQFLIACLQFVCQPKDNTIHKEIIEFLVKAQHIKSDLNDTLTSVILKNQSLQQLLANHGYSFSVQQMLQFPLYEMAETFVRIFRLDSPADPYIVFFLDAIHEYTTKKDSSIHGFLEWWESKKEKLSIVIPEGMDAIQIMTIHKAKGLEFPIVLLPFANWKIKKTKDFHWLAIEDSEIPLLQTVLVKSNKELLQTKYASVYEEEKNKTLLDNINLLYVAFTRAAERLYVFTSDETKQDNIAPLILKALSQIQEWDKQIYQSGNETLQKELITVDQQETGFLKDFISTNWRERIAIHLSTPKLSLSEEENTANSQAIYYGNLMHMAFSRIKTEKEITTVLNKMFLDGIIQPQELAELSEKINLIIHSKDILPFFQEGLHCFTEQEILLSNGKVVRPDRLIINGKNCILIDFKTGKPSPMHHQQMNKYESVLKGMDYEKTEKYLIYIGEELQLVKVE